MSINVRQIILEALLPFQMSAEFKVERKPPEEKPKKVKKLSVYQQRLNKIKNKPLKESFLGIGDDPKYMHRDVLGEYGAEVSPSGIKTETDSGTYNITKDGVHFDNGGHKQYFTHSEMKDLIHDKPVKGFTHDSSHDLDSAYCTVVSNGHEEHHFHPEVYATGLKRLKH